MSLLCVFLAAGTSIRPQANNASAIAPSAPAGLEAKCGIGWVTLTWIIITRASGYNVYRSTVPGQRGEKVATVPRAIYSDGSVTRGMLYYYTVTTLNGEMESAASAQVSGLPGYMLPISKFERDFSFGDTTAVVADGRTVIVTDTYAKDGQGAVYAFTKSDSGWSQSEILFQSDGPHGADFGSSVAVSSDGTKLVIGAANQWVKSKNARPGAVYVFTKAGDDWVQAQQLVPSEGEVSEFGARVATSSDGSVLIIGANRKRTGGNARQGIAYVFTKSGSGWSQTQELTPPNGVADDYFGWSLASSRDGNTLLVGACQKYVYDSFHQGAVYVYTRTENNWVQTSKLTASDGADGDFFGSSLACSSEGSTLIIGAAYKKNGKNVYQGAVYVFTKSGSAWLQVQELVASEGDGRAYDNFGYSVAISSKGNALVVGASGRAVFVFTPSESGWYQTRALIGGNSLEMFGQCVGVSEDGGTIIVGSPGDTNGRPVDRYPKGAAYVYTTSW
jgi:hypothetical protein